jgi:hypothetical protein
MRKIIAAEFLSFDGVMGADFGPFADFLNHTPKRRAVAQLRAGGAAEGYKVDAVGDGASVRPGLEGHATRAAHRAALHITVPRSLKPDTI